MTSWRASNANLPRRPYREFIGREEELRKLKTYLRFADKKSLFVISGQGGVGKTALALETGYYYIDNYDEIPPEDRFEFIIWTSAKAEDYTPQGRKKLVRHQATLAAILQVIAKQMLLPTALTGGEERQISIIKEALSKNSALLIVDNFDTISNSEAVAEFFQELSDTRAKIIITSRIESIKEWVIYIRLKGLNEPEALKLVEQHCNLVPKIPLAADRQKRIIEVTQGLPLAIAVFMGRLRGGVDYFDLISKFSQGIPDLSDYCFQGTLDSLKGRKAEELLMALVPIAVSVSSQQLTDLIHLDVDSINEELSLLQMLFLVTQNPDGRFALTAAAQEYLLGRIQEDRFNDFLRMWAEYYIEFVSELTGPYGRFDKYSHTTAQKIQTEIDNIHSILNSTYEVDHSLYCNLLEAVRYITYSHGNWVARDNLMRYGVLAASATQQHCKAALFASDIAWVATYNRQYDKAERLFEEAESYLKDCTEPYYKAKILRDKARFFFFKGYEEQAEALYGEAISEAERSKIVPTELITCLYYFGLFYYEIRNPREAKIHLSRGLDIAKQHNATREVCRFEALLAQIESGLGHVDEARKILERVVHLAEDYKDWIRTADYKFGLAKIEHRVGNNEGALVLLADSEEIYKQIGRHHDEELIRAYRRKHFSS